MTNYKSTFQCEMNNGWQRLLTIGRKVVPIELSK